MAVWKTGQGRENYNISSKIRLRRKIAPQQWAVARITTDAIFKKKHLSVDRNKLPPPLNTAKCAKNIFFFNVDSNFFVLKDFLDCFYST